MAKDLRSKTTPAPEEQDQVNKWQKKQAKKEAKMMLAIEQVKDSLEKAQGKLARVQARVGAREAHLHNLEEKLAAARAASPSTTAPLETPESGFDQQGGQADAQEGATDKMELAADPAGENNHASSTQDTVEAPAQTTATSGQQSGENLPAATTQRPVARTSRSSTTRSASTKSTTPATSSTTTRRATTRKHANTNSARPEASNDNKNE